MQNNKKNDNNVLLTVTVHQLLIAFVTNNKNYQN